MCYEIFKCLKMYTKCVVTCKDVQDIQSKYLDIIF